MKMIASPRRRDRRPKRFLHVLLLARGLEPIARRQRGVARDLLHVGADVARRTTFDVCVDADAPLQVLPLDDLRARRLDEVRHLSQRHHPHLPVGPAPVRRQVQVREIRRELAAILRQLDVDLVVLAIGPQPVADRVAGEQRPDRRADLLDRDAEIGGCRVVEPDRQRRIGRLVRCLEVRDARHLLDLRREGLRRAWPAYRDRARAG